MKIRIAAVLATATALAAGLAAGATTALPAFAADPSTTLHSSQPPYDIAVTSALDSPGGALQATVSTTKPILGTSNPAVLPAGDHAARWALWYIPSGGTAWQNCAYSDPSQFWSFSPSSTSTYTLANSAFKDPAHTQTRCGDGIYGLVADGAAFVNGAWHGVQNVYSGPAELHGSTPPAPPVTFFSLRNASAAAAAAASANKGAAAAAATAAPKNSTLKNASSQIKNLASQKAKTAAQAPPALKSVSLPPRNK